MPDKIYSEGDVRAISLLGFIRGVELNGVDPTERVEVKAEFLDHRQQLATKPGELKKFLAKLEEQISDDGRAAVGRLV